jgi:hypothetical protein
MSIEVTVAIIGAASALLGAAVGAIASIWTTKTQLKASIRLIEIEQLRRVESLIETFLQRWNEMKVDASGSVNMELIASRFTDRFLSRCQLFLGVSHHFPRDIEEELSFLSKEVNGHILTVKTGGVVDGKTATEVLKRTQELEERIFKMAGERLRRIQNEILSISQK